MSARPSTRIDDPPEAPDGAALAFPASYAQERMWFFYRRDPQDVSYNVPLLLHLTGELDTDALQAALNDLIARHETLRTIFAESDGGLWQIVAEHLELPLPTTDVSALLGDRPPGPLIECEPVQARLVAEIRRPFDLEHGPLLRAQLVRLGCAEHCLLVCVHHIVIDGWSIGVFLRELAHAYRARLGGAAPAWTPLEIQYGDYAEWQRETLDGQSLADGLAYWRQRLAGDLPAVGLPTDRPPPPTRTFAGDRLDFTLSPDLTAGIKGLCRGQGTTLYMVLLTGFVALVRRYTGHDDILVGSPAANRDNPQIEPLIGMFVNTLPLRVDTSGNPSFVDLLHRVREVNLGAFAHQHIPLEKIVQEVAPQRDSGGKALVRVVFALQNFERPDIELPGVTVSLVDVPDWTCRFDLELHLWEEQEELRGALVFATELFERRTAERMTEALRRVFEAVTTDPDCRLADLPLGSEQDQALLAQEVTDDREGTVTARFAAQVAARPQAVAVCGAGFTASYREIDTWSTRLATDLIGGGVAPGARVALCAGRRLDAVIGLLGVLKAGAVCLPLDPADPPDRLLRLMRNAAVGCLLTTEPSAGLAAADAQDGEELTVINLGNPQYRDRPAEQTPPAPEIQITGSDPALMLCAEPCPVTVEHAELLRHLDLVAQVAGGLTEEDTTRWWAPVGTQRSVWEMLLPLCHGARMAVTADVPPDDTRALPEDGATVLLAVDRDLAGLTSGSGLAAARAVVCTDRGLDVERAARLGQALGERLRWVYCPAAAGPVAATPPGLATAEEPALRPLRPVVVLDEYGAAVPLGGYGVVHIGRPAALTTAPEGGRLLRTGDLGRITVDGTLELCGPEAGRAHVADHTIDLSAVAEQVMGHESVRDCVVRVRHTAAGVAELVAYVVPARELTEEQIVRAARPALPAAVALAAVVLVSDLPRTTGGRLDEAALAHFPVLDGQLAARWERRWHASAERGRAAVVVTAGRAAEGSAERVRLSEPVGSPGAPAPKGTAGSVDGTAPPSVSVGPPLRRLELSTLDAALRRVVSIGGQGESLYIGPDGALERQSYAELLEQASRLLGGLRGLGLVAGDTVLLQLAGNRDFVVGFWVCVLGGYVAVPLAVPPLEQPDGPAAAKLAHAWESLGHPLVLTSGALTSGAGERQRVAVIDELMAGPADHAWHATRAEDLVLLMLTSGSTGTPKAVRLSHDNLLTHAAAARQHHDLTPADVSFNWMPMDHVGGLVMFHVRDVVLGCRQIHAPTQWVLADPLRWISAMHTHRVTVTWAPNFAFGLINEQAARIAAQHWDLSALRVVLNGGEAVVDRVARRFVQLLAPHGLPPGAMHPIWGMSETSSGQIATVLPEKGAALVEVGRPYPGFAIRITDEAGTVVPEGTVGHLQVRGPAVTSGYHNDPDSTRAAFTDDGWFRTGDLGVLRGGALTITGRAKDVIIIGGVNHPSHELEAIVEELDDVAQSFTAACAVRTAGQTTDELALFFVLASGADPARAAARIRATLVRAAGVTPSYLIPVDRERIPKTEIGKIQRSKLVQQFQDGAFDTEIARMDALLCGEHTLPNWFFRPVWQPAELLHRPLPPTHGHTLLLADRHGLAERLAEALRAHGLTCTLACYGTTFVRHAADRFALPWDNPGGYDRLLDAIPPVERVVHLACYAPHVGAPNPEEMALTQRDGVECLAQLITALAGRAAPRPAGGSVRLSVVSSGSQQVRPEEPLAVERTPVIGLVKSLDQELPWLRARHIDVPPDAGAQVIQQLLAEIHTPAGEVEVALRQRRRWARRLAQLPGGVLPESPPVFQEGGRYVISGGLGGVAVEVARHLLTTHRVRLLLLGRTELPDPATWDRLIAGGEELGGKLSAYRELRALGDVAYAAVDITDAKALRQAVRTAEEQWSAKLSGVLHLAGHFDERSVIEQSAQQRAAVLAPKVAGGWVLHQLVQDRPGTLFLSFSSVNGFLGGSGVGMYSAANTFLDALAAYQRREGVVEGRSLAWSMWDERGMSRGYGMRELTAARGYRILGAREALRSLDVALRHDAAHVLIGLDADAAWVRAHVHAPARPLRALVCYRETEGSDTVGARPDGPLPDRYGTPTWCELVGVEELPAAANGALDRDQLARSGAVVAGQSGDSAPATDLERAIARIWCETLERDRIGVRENFFELGGHSILATQLLGRLRDALGVELTVAALFEDPTIAGLAARIDQAGEESAGGMLDVVLALRPRGSRAPLFCIHPGAGVSWPYAALLGGLHTDRPLYGLQARGLHAGQAVAASVAEMAADYLRQIRAVHPHGPYHLLGWSFGGLVAHAMATQLRAEGERVGLLALLDAWPVGAATEPPPLPTDEELDRALMEILLRSAGNPLQGLDDRKISALREVMANNTKLHYTYVPGWFDADLVFFTASSAEFTPGFATQESWRPFVGGQIKNHVIAGTHHDMLRPEAAEDIAHIIETELQQ